MEKVTLQQAKEDLTRLFAEYGARFKTFDVEKDKQEGNSSFINDNEFMIDKRHIERMDVICILMDYFKDRCILNGGCSVGPITFLFTDVTLFDTEHPLKSDREAPKQ
jgi:hypothetical protein